MLSTIETEILKFIQSPTCLWDSQITSTLIGLKWAALQSQGSFLQPSDYSTAGFLSGQVRPDINKLKLDFRSELGTYLEDYSPEFLGTFYSDNGLFPLQNKDLNNARNKLNQAISLFDYENGPLHSINMLVRSIHVVQQSDPEIDVSHSDPKIPFSIFVSVCEEDGPISKLRVAESLLHESMHLKLSLVENIFPLVKKFKGNLYFSPWRGERRPAQGVLHGIFVFKAVSVFLKSVIEKTDSDSVNQYLVHRVNQIDQDLQHLRDFMSCEDLTQNGASLVKNLLPLN